MNTRRFLLITLAFAELLVSGCGTTAPAPTGATSPATSQIPASPNALSGALVGTMPPVEKYRAPFYNESMFRRFTEWQAPNTYRTASGAPGHQYWQQKVDYRIEAKLDTAAQTLSGTERITYTNNSPDTLRYLWLQLDQNNADSAGRVQAARPAAGSPGAPRQYRYLPFYGGYMIQRVERLEKEIVRAPRRSSMPDKVSRKIKTPPALQNAKKRLAFLINDTVMRVELDEPLAPNAQLSFEIDWTFPIPFRGRMGRERVGDGWIYQMAQWQPRLCVYDDLTGWQTDQYLGAGEFYTEFGDWTVELTVPASHLIIATGTLQNPEDVLTAAQRSRLAQAMTSDKPVMIVDEPEILTPNSRPVPNGDLTWKFKAEHVRDFAFGSSQAFLWDAASVAVGSVSPDGAGGAGGSRRVLCQSAYPREALPLWKNSTEMVRFSIQEFSKWMPYPYPMCANVNSAAVDGGMEYPMIVFCRDRYNEVPLFGTTTHEVGHQWFPMVVQTDERRYAWLDEGLNSFISYYSELGRYPDRKARRGSARDVVRYLKSPQSQPLMTHSHAVRDLGSNAYAKTTAGLVMLREQILGAERFDRAFKEYCRRWAFRHPSPVDFFRTMEDAAGEDLAWFWRGWFYSTGQLDQAVDSVSQADSLGQVVARLYLSNRKELVMPVKLRLTLDDSSTLRRDLPVEIWLQTNRFAKEVVVPRRIVKVEVDPEEKFPDGDPANNVWESKPLQTPQSASPQSAVP